MTSSKLSGGFRVVIASRIHPSLSPVDRDVEFCVPTIFFLFFHEEKYQFE